MSDHSTTPSNKDASHCNDVGEFLRILIEPGSVFEVRSIKCPDKPGGTYVSTASGWFNDTQRAALGVEHLEAMRPPAVYVTINPVMPALLARAANRIGHQAKSTTAELTYWCGVGCSWTLTQSGPPVFHQPIASWLRLRCWRIHCLRQ